MPCRQSYVCVHPEVQGLNRDNLGPSDMRADLSTIVVKRDFYPSHSKPDMQETSKNVHMN